jgi:hypothetical protein
LPSNVFSLRSKSAASKNTVHASPQFQNFTGSEPAVPAPPRPRLSRKNAFAHGQNASEEKSTFSQKPNRRGILMTSSFDLYDTTIRRKIDF